MKHYYFLLVVSARLVGAEAQGAVNLTDFGYANPIRNNNGWPALGSRRLLIILARYGSDQLAFGTNYYDDIVFTNANLNVAGFFREMSNGRFEWSRAGLVSLDLPDSERQVGNGGQLGGDRYYSNIVYRAMGQLAFANFDSRPPFGTVTDDELEIAVFSTDFGGGGLRGFGTVARDGITTTGTLAIENHAKGLPTVSHELMHGLGFYEDIYATICTPYVTVMMWNCGEGEQEIIHADAWHKVQLGWCEPRIHELGTGGVVRLPATQMRRTDAPVILYDRQRGTDEFFLLEYRTPVNALGAPWSYDRNLQQSGLLIWQVQHTPSKDLGFVAPHPAGRNGQLGWGECAKCNGLYYQPNESISRCPDTTGGPNHTGARGLLALVYDNANEPGQTGWRWCRRCQGLFDGQRQGTSNCPVGGMHDGSQSVNYTLRFTSQPPPAAVSSWRWCQKCEGAFGGTNQPQSNCPVGSTHDGSASADYSLWQYDRSVFTVSYPDMSRGGTNHWPAGAISSSYLNWVDWTPTRTRIHVRPFNPTDQEITVEWWTETDTWVDFNYTGTVTNGLEATPYKTMAHGVANAPWGGTVKFKPGSKNETAVIDKRLTFEAPLGLVTIGQ